MNKKNYIKYKEIDLKQFKIDYLIDRLKIAEIAKKWGISEPYVYMIMAREGIKKRGKSGQRNIKVV